jgi:hypothetical protein
MNVVLSRIAGLPVAHSSSVFALLVAFTPPCPNSYAVFLNNDYTNVQPFSVYVEKDTEQAIELTLRISNEADNPASIVSWQLELALNPLEGSQGELLFSQVTVPQNSLFGNDPGPLADLEEPSSHMSVFDADYDEFSGVQLDPREVRNIATLVIPVGLQSVGHFELVARAHEASTPDLGSSWFPTGASEPQAFENLAASALPGFFLLGTFHIQSTNQPGDYNNDQIIDELDYQQWRLTFGASTENHYMGSDGNGNSIVDAADYVTWRNLATGSMDALSSGEAVPESLIPHWQAIFVLSLTSLSKYRCHRSAN